MLSLAGYEKERNLFFVKSSNGNSISLHHILNKPFNTLWSSTHISFMKGHVKMIQDKRVIRNLKIRATAWQSVHPRLTAIQIRDKCMAVSLPNLCSIQDYRFFKCLPFYMFLTSCSDSWLNNEFWHALSRDVNTLVWSWSMKCNLC